MRNIFVQLFFALLNCIIFMAVINKQETVRPWTESSSEMKLLFTGNIFPLVRTAYNISREHGVV